jgi:hypothetical protein
MRRLIVLFSVLAVLAVVLVAADFIGGRVFEDRAGKAIQSRLGLEQPPSVQVRDFPFLLSLARERLSTVDVAATDFQASGVAIDDLQLTMRDVRVPRGLAFGRPGTVVVERADGRARIVQEEVERLLGQKLKGATVRIDERGMQIEVRQEVFGREVDAVIRGTLAADKGRLVFTPTQVDAGGIPLPAAVLDQLKTQPFEYPLPELPGGLVPQEIITEPGALVVTGSLGRMELDA